ncbi:MAG: GIY-YIG nuclease family protein [candidate division Zixibacteria bacterium]|nr:GIY-YIG nuclease family protein [candidate division Zixibacteria bacterium]
MYYVYVLYSKKDGKLYIGQTEDIDRRVNAHNAGKVKSTKHRRPLILVHSEKYSTRTEAIERERELKSISARDFKRKLRQKASEI